MKTISVGSAKMLQLHKLLQQQQEIIYTPHRGFLRIFGKDCKNFVQRMSTGNIDKLSPKNPVGTCFITNKGKMVDFVVVFERAVDDIILLSSAHDNHHLYQWLLGFHFAEDLSFDEAFLGQCHILVSPKPCQVDDALKLGTFSYQGTSWSVRVVHGSHVGNIDDDAWQTVRIMALLPEYPQEIHENYLPDTINLEQFVADNKGCYIGQEVISKARLYQKHKKTLVGIELLNNDWAELTPQTVIPGPLGEECLVVSKAPLYLPDVANALVVTDREKTDETRAFLSKVVRFVTKSPK